MKQSLSPPERLLSVYLLVEPLQISSGNSPFEFFFELIKEHTDCPVLLAADNVRVPCLSTVTYHIAAITFCLHMTLSNT